jgi:hypothetical protein
MQQHNFWLIPLTAFIPLIVGFIWYNKMIFGNAWMQSAGLTEAHLGKRKMAFVLGLTYVFSNFLVLLLMNFVIHQLAIYSIFANDPGAKDPNTETGKFIVDFFAKNGQNFRTFKHGVFHGILFGLFGAMPIMAINALFERRTFKYVAVHTGYWIITLALIGGVICQFLVAY